ncbi:MAG: hypothetical protein AAGA56_21955 [Myxococcota bacterium]
MATERSSAVFFVSLSLASGALACDQKEPAAAPEQTASAAPSASTEEVGGVDEAPPEDPDSCRQAPACAYEGRCDGEVGACRATSARDCAASQGCRDWGACGLGDDGACIALERRHCTESYGCGLRGRCTPDHGSCVVAEDRDCRQSELCKRHKLCVAKAGWCRRK